MFFWLICLVLVLLMIGSTPRWPHSREWGYMPSTILLIFLILFLVMWMAGWTPLWMHHGGWGGGGMNGQHMP